MNLIGLWIWFLKAMITHKSSALPAFCCTILFIPALMWWLVAVFPFFWLRFSSGDKHESP
jgi:hypothetical protein